MWTGLVGGRWLPSSWTRDRYIVAEAAEAKVPSLLVVNKGDQLGDAEWVAAYRAMGDFLDTVVVSAITGQD